MAPQKLKDSVGNFTGIQLWVLDININPHLSSATRKVLSDALACLAKCRL